MLSLAVLRKEKMLAFKAGNKSKASLISVFLSDLQLLEKEGEQITEKMIISAIASASKKARSNLKICEDSGRAEGVSQYKAEIAIYDEVVSLSSLTSMTEQEILDVVQEVGATQMSDMGKVMAKLKTDFGGRFDPSKASALIRSKLA
ncbi:putative GatB/YqeY domain-containing protein [Vibrio chagasii]|nr:putative GatB/YqeY domain-containing protein [Vibrio chagasii]